ncbi:hypothetical protein [uncultured Methanoregula sp.]|uniref:hypothetical protein n=1 Tax=uncultured Methanoregula sp. TaxID=1005933 RepID=UPI002AABF5C6|nr:hypothetical protein [uncultured Methanoregula sp.]
MSWFSDIGATCWILVVIIAIPHSYIVSAAPVANSLVIGVRDAQTRETVGDALVYFDGGYQGTTSVTGDPGKLVIQDVRPGSHTVRVTKPDFKEVTKKFVYPDETAVEVTLSKGPLVSLNPNGPSPHAIDVVFYPSSTSYSCAEKKIVSNTVYLTNETRFREDVMNVIRQTYLNLGQITSPSDPLPENFQERFNFYYYYDPSRPADAFSGCAGTVPESYWSDVPFSDITVILYPTYYGIYKDTSCQPTGCFQNFGPGRSLMKAPADQASLVRHETGHAVFGLIDTYCGSTYYYQNDPYANVWSSLESCKADAQSHNRDPALCRQIQTTSSIASSSCTKDFWHWDPNPDMMGQSYGGKFGAASTQRINYVLSQSETG